MFYAKHDIEQKLLNGCTPEESFTIENIENLDTSLKHYYSSLVMKLIQSEF